MDLQKLFEQAHQKQNNGLIGEAVVEYQQARALALRAGDNDMALDCLHMIGVSLYQDKKYEAALDYLELALDEAKKLEKKLIIGAVWRDLGSVASAQKDYVKALKYTQESIGIFENTEYVGHLGISQVKKGKVLGLENRLDEAEQQIKEGIKNIEKSPDRFFEAMAYKDLAEVQIRMGKKDEAKESVQKSREVLNQLGGEDSNQSLRQNLQDILKEIK